MLKAEALRARSVVVGGVVPTFSHQEPKVFPRDRFGDLLFTGFRVRGREHETEISRRLNIRDLLITVLLHGGGLRESEPFHLYVSDVFVDPANPASALVKLYHPVEGRAPADFEDLLTGKRIEGRRDEYLREKWRLEPRNRVAGRFRAGWKDLLLSDRRNGCAYVYWFPSFWGEVFLKLFQIYITQSRSRHCRHPFLFVSGKEGVAGEPYTLGSFRQAHARAVRRIGLKPIKEQGTTPHGHRHGYGQNLADAKIDSKVIKEAMHHKALASQDRYTSPGHTAVFNALQDAEKRLSLVQGGSPLNKQQVLTGLTI